MRYTASPSTTSSNSQAVARYDEIDLTRKALEYLEQHGDQFRYDLVVCDEVQDFTDVQLALLFRLATDPRRTVLTGDPKQIINPSGFRWEEVRARYYERGLQGAGGDQPQHQLPQRRQHRQPGQQAAGAEAEPDRSGQW